MGERGGGKGDIFFWISFVFSSAVNSLSQHMSIFVLLKKRHLLTDERSHVCGGFSLLRVLPKVIWKDANRDYDIS